MTRTASRCTVGVVRALGVGAVVLGLSLARLPTPANAQAPEAPAFEMPDFGVVPRPAVTQVLPELPGVQRELKITEAQKKEQAEIDERRFERIQKARDEIKDRAKFQAARDAIVKETVAAQLATLKPEQLERLAQIQLQAQGPLAFSVRERDPGSSGDYPGQFIGPPLSEQLKLTDEQVKRVRTIAEEGTAQIEKAASFRVPSGSRAPHRLGIAEPKDPIAPAEDMREMGRAEAAHPIMRVAQRRRILDPGKIGCSAVARDPFSARTRWDAARPVHEGVE